MLELVIAAVIAVLQVAAPVLGGILSVPLAELLKRGLDWFKRQPEWVMALLVPVAAIAITYLSGWVGSDLPGDLWMWDQETVATILVAAIGYAIYALKRLVGLERALRARGLLLED